MTDTGNIRQQVIDTLVSDGYKVECIQDMLVLNDKVEIGMSDSLIEYLVSEERLEAPEIALGVLLQYESLMSN